MEQELRQLVQQKDTLELTLAALTQQIELLEQTKGFQAGLVDAQGFPRADIDFGELASYKSLKRKKAELNNDHLAVMKQVEQRLFALHASYPPLPAHQASETHEPKHTPLNFKKEKEKAGRPEEPPKSEIDYLTPFGRVSLVDAGSPAERAGLRAGDFLSQFAKINIYAMDWMKEIPGAVREGEPVSVVVMRRTEDEDQPLKRVFLLRDGNHYQKLVIQLVPGQWEGRGLLGCKIDPLPSLPKSE